MPTFISGTGGGGATLGSNSFTNNQIITNATAGSPALVVKGASGQSVNTFEIQNTSGVAGVTVGTNANSLVVTGSNSCFGTSTPAGSNSALTVQAPASNRQALIVKAAASQSVNILECYDNGNSTLVDINGSGRIRTFTASIQLGALGGAGVPCEVGPVGPSGQGCISLGGAAQRFYYDSAGVIVYDHRMRTIAGNEAATSSAGAGGALPVTVQGYITFTDSGGATRKIPYFAN